VPAPTRFDRSVNPWVFAQRALVRCPVCDGLATVLRSERLPRTPGVVRATCLHCGYHRERSTTGDGRPRDRPAPVPGMVCEQVHGLALWLQTPCCGHTLWAFNEEHLGFVRDFVAADLRERALRPGWDGELRIEKHHGNLPATLPTWIKLAKHRREVLAAADGLAATLPPQPDM
jgi:hypothetical protein